MALKIARAPHDGSRMNGLYAKQFADRHLRVTSDEVDDPVMGAAEPVCRKDRVRLGREVAVGEEQQFDPLPHRGVTGKGRVGGMFYVSHIDISRNLRYHQKFLSNIRGRG